MNKALKIVLWTAGCVLFVLLFGYITMFLWNWIIPSVFNVNPISYWQALGLLLLSKIFFGGWGGSRWHHAPRWKYRYYERLSSMTPEEKERFKARMREKWGCTPKSTSSQDSNTSIG